MALNLDSPVGELLDTPATRAVLDRLMPGFSTSPRLAPAIAMRLSLRTVAKHSGGLIDAALLERTGAAFAEAQDAGAANALGSSAAIDAGSAARSPARPAPAPFPADEPRLRGYYAPLLLEGDVSRVPIDGAFPRELEGTLYRIGPNPQFAPRGPYHWFAGDGMVHAFRVADGRVSYRNRWVRTPKWRLEHEAGEGLSGAFGNPLWSDPRIVALDSTVANTNVITHRGRLLALEEAHPPFALDADTLEPLGEDTFGGRLAGPFTAHPKLDPTTGETIAFGYSTRGRFSPWAQVSTIGADGAVRRTLDVELPFASMVHDFAVTEHWIVLPVFPLTGSMDRTMAGGPPFAWEPELGTRIALIPRRGDAPRIAWIEAPPCYVFHPMNHFEDEDGTIVVDVMRYDVAPLFPRPDGRPASEAPSPASLHRWRIDPRAGSLRETRLDDRAGEFPRFDERRCTRSYRHGWIVSGDEAFVRRGEDATEGLIGYDLMRGTSQRWIPQRGDRCGEPVFVPRSADAPEGDGWLLATVWRRAENRSDLAVFEAQDLAAGPIGLATLSHRVPAGFHGNWAAR
ncbi:MAG: carotenoid oxygenase family protein [Burkholderiaceae bacterium]|nr:carotenoid oxygenase family protein [Burkholderiales bacterium]MCZ8336553.1 carotenoid oxygenase family protein [Burkholderiaceae bacterium]